MKRILDNRPTPSMIVALVALFVAMGGVSYAAATIGSAQIKNNSVRSKDIRNNDVRGKDIRTGTLGGTDVKDKALRGADILSSSLSKVPSANRADAARTAGHANSAGNAAALGGVPASSYPSSVEIVTDTSATVTPDGAKYDHASATASCPAGKRVIGGGGRNGFADFTDATLNVAISSSAPSGDTEWRVRSVESGDVNEETLPWSVTAFAICASASGAQGGGI